MTELTYATPEHARPLRWLITAIEYSLGRRNLEHLYDRILARTDQGESYWAAALDSLGALPDFAPEQLAKIPKRGPLVFIANHPFGILDGLTLCHLAQETRGPFKILINAALCREPRLEDYFLPVDFSDDEHAAYANARSARTVIRHLRGGGVLVVFPAGGISTATGWGQPVTDLPWNPFVSSVIRSSEATVLPVFFPGQNSPFFQWASLVNMKLRLAFIMGEVHRQKGAPIPHIIGDPIPFERLPRVADRERMTDELRRLTYQLASTG